MSNERSDPDVEAAYYRFVFCSGIAKPPAERLLTPHTLLTADYRTGKGLRLQAPPFSRYREHLRDPVDYHAAQALATNDPTRLEAWLCETSAQIVRFYSEATRDLQTYRIELFQVEGELPEPAI